MKTKELIILMFALLIISTGTTGPVYAWGSDLDVPLPARTEQEKTETRRLGEDDLTYSYYNSTLSAEEIREFFRRRLSSRGWQEKDVLEDARQAQGFQEDEKLNAFLSNNLTFQKEEELMIISILPEQFTGRKRTKFTICRGIVEIETDISADNSLIPELITVPAMEDVIPAYPQASLVNLSESDIVEQATYLSRDNIEDVLEFYKSALRRYGWSLTREIPAAEMEFKGVSASAVADSCPSCPKSGNTSLADMRMFRAELAFVGDRGEVCRIFLSSIAAQGTGSVSMMDMTTILVHYEKE